MLIAAYIKNLCQESKDTAVKQLLMFLPLLRCGNLDAKVEYLKIIPQILTHSIENVCHLEESRQLLSYCLIHPAISGNERLPFHKYTVRLSHLEEQQFEKQNREINNKENLSQKTVGNNAFITANDFQSNAQQEFNNAWQNRDSGIGLEQFASYISTSQQIPTGGRAITSTSACSPDGQTQSMNMALAGHTALQASLSGPVPYSQSIGMYPQEN